MASCGGLPSEDKRRWLECQICLCSMVGRKPRGLNCLHTFCEPCLGSLPLTGQIITCPTCRRETKLSADGVCDLPVNFMIEHMTTSLHQVDLCQTCVENEGTSNQAAFYCSDGCGRLCSDCKIHHDLVDIIKTHQVDIYQTSEESSSRYCLTHNKSLILFCTKCETCLCSTCALSLKHRNHDNVIKEMRNEYERLGSNIKEKAKAIKDTCKIKMSVNQTERDQMEQIKKQIENEYRRRQKELDAERVKLLGKVNQLLAPLIDFDSKIENLREGSRLIAGRIKMDELETSPRQKMLEVIHDTEKCNDMQQEADNLKLPSVLKTQYLASSSIPELGQVFQIARVGCKVRVRSDVEKPRYNWGAVSHDSIGTVTSIEGEDCRVDFPSNSNWKGLVKEMEVVPD